MHINQIGPRPVLLYALLAIVVPSAFSQPPQAGGPQGPAPTFAEMQKSQSWATRNLEKSPRHQEWVTISNGGRTLKAWVVHPKAKGKLPVVLVLHEVFGLTDSTRNTADQIAAMGYLVIAPDMLSGRGPDGGNTDSFPSSHVASQTITSLPNETVNSDLDAWANYGIKLPDAKSGGLAVVGLSWGGGAAFRYTAAQPKNLKAVFVFYDVGPPTITQGPDRETATGSFPVDTINVPVYGFYPSKDTRVMKSLQATRDAMAAQHKTYDPIVYEGAEHAYMRVGSDPADSNPANAAAVKASLTRLETLLKQTLK
jgi:carboxymethylenebutenolidase